METAIKCDQGYESFDSMSACGSERKSSLSDAEFDPISDDENDDEEYSKPGVDDGVIQALSEKLKDGMLLVSRAPMKNIDSVRENRRESAQPWSVQTQNSVTPSGGRLIRASDKNDSYTRQHTSDINSFINEHLLRQNLHRNNNTYNNLTGQQNIAGNNFTTTGNSIISKNLASFQQATNTNTSTTNLAGNNIISKNLASFQQATNTITSTTNLAGNNIISKNLASFHPAANTNLATINNNTNIISKNLTCFHPATSTNLATINNNTISNNFGYHYEQTPPSASSDEVNEEISLSDFPELQEFAKIFAEDEDSGLGCIRYLFQGILPELSASDVNEGLGHIDQTSELGKISPVSFSSTIVPPSLDSYPSSPISSDLLDTLTSHEQSNISGAVHNESVVPDILSMPQSNNTDHISTLLAEHDSILDQLDILKASSNLSAHLQTLNVPTVVTKYTSDSEYSSSNNFLQIRDQRVSFSTNSTPSHSIEYSPLSSAESQSPYSNSSNDLELYSPNIIPVTVNDDLGEDDSRASSRQENVSAKERLYQKIMTDPMLKRAKDSAWFEASISKQEKLVIMIQKLCKATSDKCLEARLYANVQVYLDNASQDDIRLLFKSVAFLQHTSIVNNPLLTAYIREIMLNHGVD